MLLRMSLRGDLLITSLDTLPLSFGWLSVISGHIYLMNQKQKLAQRHSSVPKGNHPVHHCSHYDVTLKQSVMESFFLGHKPHSVR